MSDMLDEDLYAGVTGALKGCGAVSISFICLAAVESDGMALRFVKSFLRFLS